MQFLPREVLTNILNVLPWNEAIRFESLSSQFYELPYEKPFMSSLIMCGKPHWRFSIFDYKAQKYYDFIMMMNYDEASKDVFLNDIFMWPNGHVEERMERALRKYQFWKGVEPGKIVEFAAHIYRKLMRRFRFKMICLSRLPEKFYRSIYPVNPKTFIQNQFHFKPIGTKLNDAEWDFLMNINVVSSFNFFGDPEFEGAMDLWSLPCVQMSGKLTFGFKIPFESKVSMGLDDIILQKLIDRKITRLSTNTVCSVTLDFLFGYIRNCLSRSTHLIPFLKLYSPDYTHQNVERFATELGFGLLLPLPCLWERNIEGRHSNDLYSIRIKFISGFFTMYRSVPISPNEI